MRAATFVVVLVIHVVFFILFAALRGPSPRPGEVDSSSILVFLPMMEPTTAMQLRTPLDSRAKARPAHPATSTQAPAALKVPEAIAKREPGLQPEAIMPPAAPDWRQEARIAANDEIENEERGRRQPSLLAPHDFSGVKPGSTDDAKPQFGWDHAATHRIERLPDGPLMVNINDRCAIVIFIIPFVGCTIGRIPVNGRLFDHMKDAPVLGQPKEP